MLNFKAWIASFIVLCSFVYISMFPAHTTFENLGISERYRSTFDEVSVPSRSEYYNTFLILSRWLQLNKADEESVNELSKALSNCFYTSHAAQAIFTLSSYKKLNELVASSLLAVALRPYYQPEKAKRLGVFRRLEVWALEIHKLIISLWQSDLLSRDKALLLFSVLEESVREGPSENENYKKKVIEKVGLEFYNSVYR